MEETSGKQWWVAPPKAVLRSRVIKTTTSQTFVDDGTEEVKVGGLPLRNVDLSAAFEDNCVNFS